MSLLGSRELRQWRDHLVTGGMKPASADRTASMLRAALNLAARDDARITNAASWRDGLTKLPDAEAPRNSFSADDVVRKIVKTAYKINASFGLLVETAAITGARPSQLLRLEVGDLNDSDAPRLMMPSSRKGRRRRVTRKPIPITAALSKALRRSIGGRSPTSPLLVRLDGAAWRDHGITSGSAVWQGRWTSDQA